MIISAFGFLIGWFQQDTIYNINWFVLQECGDIAWRMSDCEELVGVFRTVPLPYPIYTPFLQVRVDSIVSAVLALVK